MLDPFEHIEEFLLGILYLILTHKDSYKRALRETLDLTTVFKIFYGFGLPSLSAVILFVDSQSTGTVCQGFSPIKYFHTPTFGQL